MKAVMASVPTEILELRKRTGADRWDEMWQGVLHICPAIPLEHQDFEWEFETYLRLRWATARGARVYHNINVSPPGGWPDDYRIPDLSILTAECKAVNCGEYLEGPPDVVIEIESPKDETREKLGFYAALGVPEVWIVHRDEKTPEILVLSRGRYRKRAAGKEGWIHSEVTGIELRRSRRGKLAVRLRGDDSTREELPSALRK
jgi:Uma2 family endonuclease